MLQPPHKNGCSQALINQVSETSRSSVKKKPQPTMQILKVETKPINGLPILQFKLIKKQLKLPICLSNDKNNNLVPTLQIQMGQNIVTIQWLKLKI